MSYQSSPKQNGFILVEVLVGLIILSVALIAALRAVAYSADTQLAISQRTMALWSADDALNEIRMKKIWPELLENCLLLQTCALFAAVALPTAPCNVGRESVHPCALGRVSAGSGNALRNSVRVLSRTACRGSHPT